MNNMYLICELFIKTEYEVYKTKHKICKAEHEIELFVKTEYARSL